MAHHPYRGLPDDRFSRKAIAKVEADPIDTITEL